MAGWCGKRRACVDHEPPHGFRLSGCAWPSFRKTYLVISRFWENWCQGGVMGGDVEKRDDGPEFFAAHTVSEAVGMG